MLKLINIKEKGVSLYLIIVAMLIVLSLTLTLTSLVLIRFDSTKRLGDSVVAYYVADSGIEEELYYINNSFGRGSNSGTVGRDDGWALVDGDYSVSVLCRVGYTKCAEACSIDLPCSASISCPGPRLCIRSKGAFNDAKRALEVRY